MAHAGSVSDWEQRLAKRTAAVRSVARPLSHVIPHTGLGLEIRLLTVILPLAKQTLAGWRQEAQRIPDPELRRQALASIDRKAFHAWGGCSYALLTPGRETSLIRAIVAFQTISDYLDNLCDRSTSHSGMDFRCLHQAMLDAAAPGAPLHDYYAHHPEQQDGGYLAHLVRTVQGELSRWPAYSLALPYVTSYVTRYNDLQEYKHIEVSQRLPALTRWFAGWQPRYPDLNWWEFAAACGSTLAVFAAWAAAVVADRLDPNAPRLPQLLRLLDAAYFPWINGLHILLDYYIDQQEDREGEDLNLVSFYASAHARLSRLALFARHAQQAAQRLPYGWVHRLIVDGLPALYLSDPKVGEQQLQAERRHLLRAAGWNSQWLYAHFALFRRPLLRPRSLL